ncbi:hypothetical protein BJY00DRAFT_285409 [Aspergillus carlsbadensis]|nr:hypothetical protein BJY00DRAFT_285409 [Aspergillus carlsbadensis]
MPIGFGFSVGDILATLKLVGTVIDSLRESSHAGSNFRSLIQELYALETALLHVKRLELDESQNADKVALRNTACQCQRTIDAFYAKIQKYQPHLRDGGTGSRLRDGWAKIKWAVCRQDDVDTFRAEIQGHTSSIGILLATVHMRTQATGQSRSDLHQKRLGSTIQAMLREVVQKLGQIAGAMAQSVEQGKALLESSAQIVQSNMRIFQAVQQLETILRTVPPQILLQQPVYLVDAFNKPCPFHLESIRSAEALLAFLKVNLQGTGCGSGMVDREEFVIEDAGTHRSIDLTQSWDTCFFPGQRVVMSMVFRQPVHEASCPRCSAIHAASIKEQVAW